jgi:hypothetical protein
MTRAVRKEKKQNSGVIEGCCVGHTYPADKIREQLAQSSLEKSKWRER